MPPLRLYFNCGVDMGTSQQFNANISKFVKLTKIKPDLVVRKVAFDCYTAVIALSPVDTGRFRNNWQIGLGSVNGTITDEGGIYAAGANTSDPHEPLSEAPTGAVDATKLALLNKAKFGMIINISNNLPYAVALENGTSKQAPAGVLKVAYQQVVTGLERTIKAIGTNPNKDLY